MIYTKKKNYEDEAGQVRAWIEKLRRSGKTILDVACGTGEHARYLKSHFQIDGSTFLRRRGSYREKELNSHFG